MLDREGRSYKEGYLYLLIETKARLTYWNNSCIDLL
jgi:hypothetical protein